MGGGWKVDVEKGNRVDGEREEREGVSGRKCDALLFLWVQKLR